MGQIVTRGKWVRVTDGAAMLQGLNSNHIKWGERHPNDPNGGESEYEFKGVATDATLDGTPFVVGTFIHHNWVILMAQAVLFEADLELTLHFADDNVTHVCTATFSHNETPNVGGYVDDEVHLPTVSDNEQVHINGASYEVSIKGFSINGYEVTDFRSKEGGSNKADVIAVYKPTGG